MMYLPNCLHSLIDWMYWMKHDLRHYSYSKKIKGFDWRVCVVDSSPGIQIQIFCWEKMVFSSITDKKSCSHAHQWKRFSHKWLMYYLAFMLNSNFLKSYLYHFSPFKFFVCLQHKNPITQKKKKSDGHFELLS